MTDELRDVMTRIADQAPPGGIDPTVWPRARRARRRGLAAIAVGVTASVAVLALATVVGIGALVSPKPVDEPAGVPGTGESGSGIPSVVRGINGDGGLELEHELAVGPASVAVANPDGAFVITADDGAYHRLALPGFDPEVYDDPEVRRTGMVGLSVSPDGSKLAYGWHAPLPDETGQTGGFVRSGIRILNLRTGRVDTVIDRARFPAEISYAAEHSPDSLVYAAVPYGLRWSPDSRFVTYDVSWTETDGITDAYATWPNYGASVYDTATRERFGVNLYNQGLGWTGWPQMVTRTGLVATADSDLVFAARDTQRRVRQLPGGEWTSGLFASGGRAILEPRVPDDRLLAVTLRTGEREQLDLEGGPARTELLGWVGTHGMLAQQDDDLVMLDLADATVESEVVGRVDEDGTDSTFSFATDYASMKKATHDFDADAAAAGDLSVAEDPAASLAQDSSGTGDDGVPDRALLVGGLAVAALLGLGALWGARRTLRP